MDVNYQTPSKNVFLDWTIKIGDYSGLNYA